jgi:hypothetical protein
MYEDEIASPGGELSGISDALAGRSCGFALSSMMMLLIESPVATVSDPDKNWGPGPNLSMGVGRNNYAFEHPRVYSHSDRPRLVHTPPLIHLTLLTPCVLHIVSPAGTDATSSPRNNPPPPSSSRQSLRSCPTLAYPDTGRRAEAGCVTVGGERTTVGLTICF